MCAFSILVDTSCDLPIEFVREHGIETLPIPFDLDGVEHNWGYWQEISDKEFYEALRNGSVAKTSQTNPETFVTYFSEYAKQGKSMLFIALSSGLSASYRNAVIALQEVKESYPDCKVYPIDSLSATSGIGLLTVLAVKKRTEGLSVEETVAFLEEKKHSCLGFFTVDDLMYLHRGGRLSRLSAVAGSVLGIKPILNLAPDGTLALKDKARNRKAALNQLVDQLTRGIDHGAALETVVITHTDCPGDAETLAEMIKETINVQQIIIVVMGPVIGAHLGPGAVTVIFEAGITRTEYENRYYP